jgi:hypothetical protein
MPNGECLERAQNRKGLENALLQCHEIMETFQGSEETLRHIRRVEESLRKLTAEAD